MATGYKNNKSLTKGIRFPHDVIAEIDANVDQERQDNPNASFSSWVIDACSRKLKAEQRKKAKD